MSFALLHKLQQGLHVIEADLDLAAGSACAAGPVPATTDEALDDYVADLKAHNRDPSNARRVRHHLTPTLLSKPVGQLTELELRRWRNHLIESGANHAMLTRTFVAVKAALNLAGELFFGAHLRTYVFRLS